MSRRALAETLQTSGWGSSRTQFQGKAGREARDKAVVERTSARPGDDRDMTVAWHGDDMFAVSMLVDGARPRVTVVPGCRHVFVFDRFGEHLSTTQPIAYLGHALDFKPTSERTIFLVALDPFTQVPAFMVDTLTL